MTGSSAPRHPTGLRGRRDLKGSLSGLSIRVPGVLSEDELEKQAVEDEPFFQKYQVSGEVLGQGTSCVVRRALRREHELGVAAKLMRTEDEEMVETVRKEFELLRGLQHSSIVEAYDMHHSRLTGMVYLMLELCGSSLKHVVTTHGRIQEHHARILFAQLAGAVCYLHCRRVVHRDLKPDNLLLSSDLRQLKIIDFNHARRLAEGGTLTSRVGSQAFAAPELLLGTDQIGERVDVWSVGMCLYYMLSGGKLFFDPNAFESITKLGSFLAQPDVAIRRRWIDDGLAGAAAEETKEVILGCLCPTPAGRLEPMLLLAHPWVSPTDDEVCEEEDGPVSLSHSWGAARGSRTTTNPMRHRLSVPSVAVSSGVSSASLQKSAMQACAIRLCAGAAGRSEKQQSPRNGYPTKQQHTSRRQSSGEEDSAILEAEKRQSLLQRKATTPGGAAQLSVDSEHKASDDSSISNPDRAVGCGNLMPPKDRHQLFWTSPQLPVVSDPEAGVLDESCGDHEKKALCPHMAAVSSATPDAAAEDSAEGDSKQPPLCRRWHTTSLLEYTSAEK